MRKQLSGSSTLLFTILAIIVGIVAFIKLTPFVAHPTIVSTPLPIINWRWATFVSQDKDLSNITFEYPDAWDKPEVDKGEFEKYTEVYIRGPRNADNTFSTSLAVVLLPPANQGGRYLNLDSMVNEFRSYVLRDFQLVSESDRIVNNIKAKDLTVKFTFDVEVTIKLKERYVFLQKGDKLYKLVYDSTEEDFDKYVGAFEHLLNSFVINH